jgi:hypothetical protein
MTVAAASHFQSAATSVVGQTEKFGRANGKSALTSRTDIVSPACQVRKVPISEVNALIRSPRQRELAAKAEW